MWSKTLEGEEESRLNSPAFEAVEFPFLDLSESGVSEGTDESVFC